MKKKTIKSIFGSDKKKKETIRVLYLCDGKSHVDLALRMASMSSFKSYIYMDNYDFSSISAENHGIFYLSKIGDVISLLPLFDRVVTTVYFLARARSADYIRLVAAASELEIPIIDIPHGMFQPARNIADDSSIIDLMSTANGLGDEALPSFADVTLNWGGEEGIGYPRYVSQNIPKQNRHVSYVPEFTLITTNSNWYLYSAEDRRVLFSALVRHMESNSDSLFIWCPHPAELSRTSYAAGMIARRPANCLLYGLDRDIFFNGIETTEGLIAVASRGISTVTTCLLDFEIAQTPIHVFACDGTKALTDSMDSVSLFRDHADLEVEPEPLRSGHLKAYDAEIFDRYVREAAVTPKRWRPFEY